MRTAVIVVLALLSPLSFARANPLTMYGSGARGVGMGGAHTAAARDSSANFYNPALLARLPNLEIDLGYRYTAPDLRLNDRSLGVDSARGTRLSVAMPGRIGPVRMGAGLSVYLPDQQLMRIRSLSQGQPRFALYDNRAQRLFLMASGAVAIGDKLSIGGGVGYLTATSGTVILRGRIGFPDASDSDLRLAMDVDVKSLVYPSIGIAYQLTPWLRVAAAYKGGVQPTTDLSVKIEGDVGAAMRDPIVEDAVVHLRTVSLAHFQPAELSVGIEAYLRPDLVVAADLVFHRWSEFRNPAALLTSELELGQFNEFLKVPEAALLTPANYHDILLPKVGIEWLAHRSYSQDLYTRLGYSYEPSPAPEQVGITNFVDNDKHTAAIGVGLTLHSFAAFVAPLSLDASFAVTHLPERAHRKLSPIDPVGDYRSSGVIWQFFGTTRFRF